MVDDGRRWRQRERAEEMRRSTEEDRLRKTAKADPPRSNSLAPEHQMMNNFFTYRELPAQFEILITSNTLGFSDGWEKCWQLGLTPWDLGQPTPVMVHLHQAGALPKGRALVPGCGSGHDVVAIACPERYVVGLDISDEAIKKAIELSSSLPNADYFTLLKEDFFTWRPTELFDLIFDYTFFCAIEPDMRSAWASQMRDLLKPDGELITLMFPCSYEEFLNPIGFKAVSIVDNELAIAPRKWKVGGCKKF
ncbi:hypothetical protein HYC85_012439 [Camellia sinensis]|uniref:Thiol methyltransferase 2 n=1 Tax=Camellia sinensis TaxID=4442 RepID=A0A7J7HF45_CAMSI|nr:hypothetical protein HYC85_012439 [Camellia sinensis]